VFAALDRASTNTLLRRITRAKEVHGKLALLLKEIQKNPAEITAWLKKEHVGNRHQLVPVDAFAKQVQLYCDSPLVRVLRA
jgi:hypothetical protein